MNGNYQNPQYHPAQNYGPQNHGHQALGTVYIGFEHAGANPPGAPQGTYIAPPQHAGYQTRQSMVNQSQAGQQRSQGSPGQAGVFFKEKKCCNTMGLLGFIVGACGLATGVAPVALAGGGLSVLGLFRKRRFLALTGVAMALLNPATHQWMGQYSQPDRHTQQVANRLMEQRLTEVNQTLGQAEAAIVAFYNEHQNTWPDDIQGNMLTAPLQDPWGSPVRYDEMNDRLLVRSFGPDRQAETADDVVSTVQHFRDGEHPVTTEF